MSNQSADILEIQQILARYVIALDSRAPQLLLACFTEDAQLSLGGVAISNITEYAKLCETALPALDATHHHLSLPAIQVEGDRAWARCYFTAQHVKNSLAPDHSLLIAGWYDDELVRTPAGWRIAKRTGTPSWISGNTAVLNYSMPTGAPPRGPGHEAPAWMR
jgi:hypothetical protein